MKNLSYKEYLHKEYEIHHAPYQPEMEFYDAVRLGQVDRVRELCRESILDKEGLGRLSESPLQNMKYHFTISAALIARECIRDGLPLPESYNLSDYYIQRADACRTLSAVSELHDEMCITYADKMQELARRTVCSRSVGRCIDYIYENLNSRITLETLSGISGLSPAYLSRLFKKETGYTISEYILSKKLETAKSMLLYSDYTIAEISAALAFPSQSYFTNVLKDECGMTPKQFRTSHN